MPSSWNSRLMQNAARSLQGAVCVVIISGMGCGAFNPAFLNLLDSTGSGQFITLNNAPGHVVVSFINNAEVSERLVSYLESPEGGGLILTDDEKRNLRPRMRFRVLITFDNGTTLPVEFISGSSQLIDTRFDANAFPDLNQNDLTNVVMICDVQRVELLPGSQPEVFIPVQLQQFDQRIINTNQQQTIDYVLDAQIQPQFRALEVDLIDADGNTDLRQNIGVRDVPAPVGDLLCGSVVTYIVTGELQVPFLPIAGTTDPAFDEDDVEQVASIGGRYEFTVIAR